MKLCFVVRRNIVQSRFSGQSDTAKIGPIPICVGKKQRLQASSMLERVVMSSGNFTAIFLLRNNRKTYKHALNGNCNCILFTKLPWSGDSKRIFQSSSEAATCPSTHLSTTHIGEGFTLPLFIAKTSSRKIVFTNFYGFWFDLTGNQTL